MEKSFKQYFNDFITLIRKDEFGDQAKEAMDKMIKQMVEKKPYVDLFKTTYEMIPYKEATFKPEEEGNYLIRTESIPLKIVRVFSTRVTKTWVESKKSFVISIDCSGQKITHISIKPIS